jgi:hypothetical protein
MFIVRSEQEFLAAFRPRDRQHVEVPSTVSFPQFVQDYLAWVDDSGVRSFVLFTAPGHKVPTGVAFRRDQSGGGAAAGMCEWCHTHAPSDRVGLLTTEVNSKKRVGINLCLDLGCAQRVEEEADRTGKNPRLLARAVLERMNRFAHDALGITEHNRG